MRLLTIKTPAGQGAKVVEMAFAAGASHASVREVQLHRPNRPAALYDVVEIETATPVAKEFFEQLTQAGNLDSSNWIVSTRHPRSLLTQRGLSEETWPVVTPALDILEDLWQFSHVSFSLMGRVFLAALLVTYGMIELNIAVMIAGLLFLPYHHQMLSMAFGVCTRKWRLAAQGLWALVVSTALIVAAGACMAYFTEPPLRFDKFGTLLTGFFIALIIGIAAALASADDAGRRELIGLAATAHITILPAWFGISLVFGFPEKSVWIERVTAFGVNVGTVVIGALIVYAVLRLHVPKLNRPKQ